MKLIVLGSFLTLALVPFITFSQSNSPQSPVEIKGEPRHHPKFENEFVRIWDVTVPAGDATLWHVHHNDNVVVGIGGAKLRLENAAAAPVETEWKFGEVRFTKGAYVHRAINIGATPFHNLTIELLQPPLGQVVEPPPVQPNTVKPILENDRVRVFRLTLAPGQSTSMHSHRLPGLAIAITEGEIEVTTPGKEKPARLSLPAADVRWRAAGVTHSIRTAGRTVFEAVDIELK
jgi:quercetin dioxygenase-like cupin family protein